MGKEEAHAESIKGYESAIVKAAADIQQLKAELFVSKSGKILSGQHGHELHVQLIDFSTQYLGATCRMSTWKYSDV